MPAWEAIVEDYLEGAGSRAAAESLRFRITLPAEARQEVETVLRLADRLADATRSVRPPVGAAERLGDHVRLAGVPGVRPNWARDGSDFIAANGVAQPGADEDAANAAIEGALGLTAATPVPAVHSDDPQSDLNVFKAIAAVIKRQAPKADESVPAGAIGRLRSKLVEAQARGEGGASPVVARRILAQLRGEAVKPAHFIGPPDVLAAGEEPDEGDEPQKKPDGE